MQDKQPPLLSCVTDPSFVWDKVAPLIERAINKTNYDWYSVEDYYEQIISKNMQLWVVYNPNLAAIFITQINNYPKKKVLTFFLVVGDKVEEWLHLHEEIIRWGKTKGCTAVQAYCRPGWGKLLDWEKTQVLLRKDI